ncbi:MAG: MBOAT family protein [Lachnospiraceae bacterium]|nr:MBOAT family protein [Lachnospiraceae bacterium]
MLFNSQEFIFLFLPIVLLGYYGLHRLNLHNGAKSFLLGASLFFYGYYNISYVALLLGSIVFNYLLHRMMLWETISIRAKKSFLGIGIALNLLLLFYFKYYNFFVENINALFRADIVTKDIVLPLGISFFTFQQISFLADSYQTGAEKYSLLDYGVFVSFFPQLIAGPIVLHQELIPQLRDEKRWRFHTDNMEIGLKYFIIGLAKKTLLADRLGSIVTLGYTYPIHWNTPGALLIILSYSLQIYFDFSGYSDMAIGLGRMFGLEIPINFNSPYKAANIKEFWDRWHMTMTRFFTKYVYIPLGGSRKGKYRTYINVLLVFTISGLWHGAAWNFVLWGCMHGVALVLYRIFKKYIDKLPQILGRLATFLFVSLAWVVFRADSLGAAKRMLMSLLAGGFGGSNLNLYYAFLGDGAQLVLSQIPYPVVVYELCAALFCVGGLAAALLLVNFGRSSHETVLRNQRSSGFLYGFLAALCIMTFMEVSVFLYFNF